MKAIKFTEKLSIVLAIVWCLLIPTMCLIELYVQPISFHIVKPIMYAWILLGLLTMFVQCYVLQWIEEWHVRHGKPKEYKGIPYHVNTMKQKESIENDFAMLHKMNGR